MSGRGWKYDHQPGWKRPYLEKMGRRLVAVRVARGLSRRELGKLAGIGTSRLSTIEEGANPVALEPIAEALEMTPEMLTAVLTGAMPDPLTGDVHGD